MRIVSLLPSATEITYSLGLEDALCGVTSDCDYPPEVAQKPVVSRSSLPVDGETSPQEIDRLVRGSLAEDEPIYQLDRGRIQQIQPDLILAQDLCRVCAVPSGHVTEALDVIGCRAQVISLDPHTLDEVIAGIEEVGRATGRNDPAVEVADDLRNRVRAVGSRAARFDRVRTLALEWADPPFSGGHWIPEMVRLAGGEDVLGIEGAASRTLSWDEVCSAAADVVVFMPCGYGLAEAAEQGRELYGIEGFERIPAARRGAVFAVDSSSHFSRPGPRLVDGLETLAWILHPEAFPKPPPGRVERVAPPPLG